MIPCSFSWQYITFGHETVSLAKYVVYNILHENI